MYTTKGERTLQSCVVLSAETQHIQALDINSTTLSLVSGRRCYQMSSQGVNGVPRQARSCCNSEDLESGSVCMRHCQSPVDGPLI